MEDSLTATVFAMNVAQWVNFRGTLYFIAFMGTLIVAVYAVLVHRSKHMQQINTQFVAPPVDFFGTPFYAMFRSCWFCVAIVMFLWIVNEMYVYWKVIDFYKSNTTGALHDFWVDFDKKFVATVVCGGVYVCWPLCNLVLEVAIWIVGIVPWYIYRMMCAPTLETARYPELPLHEQPCCVRLDMFFTECNQAKRIGFGETMWEIVTGSREPYFQCMQFQQGPYPGGPGMSQMNTSQQGHVPPPPGWNQQPVNVSQQRPQPMSMSMHDEERSHPPPQQQQQSMAFASSSGNFQSGAWGQQARTVPVSTSNNMLTPTQSGNHERRSSKHHDSEDEEKKEKREKKDKHRKSKHESESEDEAKKEKKKKDKKEKKEKKDKKDRD
jgi:hypothetical protein